MTSRPGPGIQESLQRRGSGGPPRGQVRRQPSRPANSLQHVQQQDCSNPSLEAERPSSEETVSRSRGLGNTKTRPAPIEAIHTNAGETVRPPPRGKPQVLFSNLATSGTELSVSSPHSQHATTLPTLPVPPRPGSIIPSDGSHLRRIIPGGTGVAGEPAANSNGPDAPTPAALLPGGKTVDLFPWAGSRPEDALTEALVKGGISNKPQIMNETNTARPSLWSNLKNKSGLNSLSQLFVTVLEKRQACGRVTAPNTFKPPPRLTLRDSTRESWLHDLANPAVGLRRLSRTIPHGLTGRVLLEQCLNKHIPIPRAMWLAKCVGINEMRAHKRKGQAGTITWVRGWTISVEQFLDGTIATIGQQEWKPRITYALQLATHLYKEQLVEEDHFLDWILRNLDSCLPERLFLWLLIVSISNYWTDLTSFRRRGKRLAESLLNHMEKLYALEEDNQTFPILNVLENTIVKLAVTRSACLVLPRTWERYKRTHCRLLERRPHPQVIRIFTEIGERNRRLMQPSITTNPTPKTPAGRVFGLLDNVDYSAGFRIEELAFDCMEFIPDANDLVSTVLQWASSLHREGLHRVYLVTRLLRRWDHLGADIYNGILSCIRSIDSNTNVDPHAIFRIVAELVRSKTFPTGRYLQWLIASGSLGPSRDISLPLNLPLRLITEIPLTGLSEQVRNLRYTLLRGTIYSTDKEFNIFDEVQDAICQQLPSLFGSIDRTLREPDIDMKALSQTMRYEIGIWLRQQVATNVEVVDRIPTKDPPIEESGTVCKISMHDFHIVRAYLEELKDLSILADVIGIVATSLDTNVLTSVADTLHYNHRAFKAIGAFDPLFLKIAMRYAALRTVRFPERDFLITLTDLARTAQADGQLLQLLAYDLNRFEQRNSLAACSPVSDSMVEGVQSTAVDSDNEIERILASGTSMDSQIMTRVFSKMIKNLEEQIHKGSSPSESHPVWFYRLRSFDETTFDTVLSDWLSSALVNHSVPSLHAALPPLVATGCLTLSRLLELTRQCVASRRVTQPEQALQIALEGLDNLLPATHLNAFCQPQDAYRYRLEQQKFCLDPEGHIIEAICEMLELSSDQTTAHIQGQVDNIFSDDRLLTVLIHRAIRDSKSLLGLIRVGQQFSEEASSHVKLIFNRLVDPADRLHLAQKAPDSQLATIIESTNELSLPFCQLEIQLIFCMNGSASHYAEGLPAALLGAVKSAVDRDQPSWSELLIGLDLDLKSKIREHAEHELMEASSFLCSPSTSGSTLPDRDDRAFIQKYLTVIDFTAGEAVKEDQSSGLRALIDRLKGVAEALTRSGNNHISQPHESSASISHLYAWLKALLHVAVVICPVVLHKASNQHQAALMWSLRSLVTLPVIEALPTIHQHVFDVATFVSDDVSEEVRSRLVRHDMTRLAQDAPCTFIFGTVPPRDGWFVLTKPFNAHPSSQSTSSPQTQTQQTNLSQPPHQSTQSQNSTTPLHRSPSQQHHQPAQAQNLGRPNSQYTQHPQSNKPPLPPFQRTSSNNGQNGQSSQLQQLKHMQQLQGLAQQRAVQPSPAQSQRSTAVSSQVSLGAAKASSRQEKLEMKAWPFSLRQWEILPDSGGNTLANETAISLTLFGARRV